MRKSLALALAAVLGLTLTAGLALGRPVTQLATQTLLSGEPAAQGVLASATGASITNATTAAPFLLLTGIGARVVAVQCDAVAFVGFGATCGITLATSPGCVRIGAGDVAQFFILQDTTAAMNAAGPAAFNCVVNKYF